MMNSMEMPNSVNATPKAKKLWLSAFAAVLLMRFCAAMAEPLELQSMDFTTLTGDNLQIQLSFNGPAFSPRVFHTDNPPRIALDLPGVASGMEKKPIPINVGGAESIQAIAVADRTRVVINLTVATPYQTRVEGNNIFVILNKGGAGKAFQPPQRTASVSRPTPRPVAESYAYTGGQGILNVDFRRGEKGVGRILVTLANPRTIADIREEGTKVIASFPNANLPSNLAHRMDVMDFATKTCRNDFYEGASFLSKAGKEYRFKCVRAEENEVLIPIPGTTITPETKTEAK